MNYKVLIFTIRNDKQKIITHVKCNDRDIQIIKVIEEPTIRGQSFETAESRKEEQKGKHIPRKQNSKEKGTAVSNHLPCTETARAGGTAAA